MRSLLIFCAILAVAAFTVVTQHVHNAQLLAERDMLASRAAGLPEARETRALLAAAQVTSEELERLRSDHVALERLRKELQSLKSLHASSTNPTRPVDPIPALTPEERRALQELNQAFTPNVQSREAWRATGRARASDALLSVFAASRDGDIVALAAQLDLDEGSRKHVTTLFDSLPEAVRTRYPNAEALLAGFIVQEIAHVASLQITAIGFGSGSDAIRPSAFSKVVLQPDTPGVLPAAPHNTFAFSLRYHEDGWHFIVPDTAIEKYQRLVAAGSYPP
jgi:hypothetical protein